MKAVHPIVSIMRLCAMNWQLVPFGGPDVRIGVSKLCSTLYCEIRLHPLPG